MSEDASGILFLRRDADKVKQAMQDFPKPYILRALNDKWGALFVEGDYFAQPEDQDKLLEISQRVPLLEYGETDTILAWGYAVYWQGKKVASLDILYDDIGDEGDDEELDGDDHAVIRDETAIRSLYENTNFDVFSIFDLDQSTIEQLKQRISADAMLSTEHPGNAADRGHFISLVGISEIWAMTYHWLEATGQGSNL
jgi:hypothetical protein